MSFLQALSSAQAPDAGYAYAENLDAIIILTKSWMKMETMLRNCTS